MRVAIKVRHPERIIERACDTPRQPRCPLGDQPGILAIEQHRARRAGVAQKRLDARSLEPHRSLPRRDRRLVEIGRELQRDLVRHRLGNPALHRFAFQRRGE